METTVFYTVKLDKSTYKFKGNGWGITDVVENIENKNTYHYRSKEKALRHLRGFLDSRPESESWEKWNVKEEQSHTTVSSRKATAVIQTRNTTHMSPKAK